MQVSERGNQLLHSKLPIDKDEKILAVYRHHWFAYASSWILGGVAVIVIMALAIALTSTGGSNSTLAANRVPVLAGAAVLSVVVLLGTFIPVYLRSQEQLVLTEEALLQMLQPSLFSSKVDQLNLHRIDDISVHQDFFGTVLGYGHLTVETPGEQDNYEFFKVPDAHTAAREISAAKENFEAALQAGRMHTTLGEAPQPVMPQIDPQQYQQFLQYQQWQAQQQAGNAQVRPLVSQPEAAPPQPPQPQTPPASGTYPPDANTGAGQGDDTASPNP